MRVLVTGGAGFIGSHVVDILLETGYEVIILDDLSTGKVENFKLLGKTVKFYKGSILDGLDVKKALEEVEVVFHYAGQISVPKSVVDPSHDCRINVLGTLNLLQLCVEKEVNEFVYVSSGGAIYGDSKSIPIREDHPISPISPYGVSKACAEQYVKHFSGRGLKTTILRLANVYGPRQDPKGEAGVISVFLNQVKQKEALTVFGDGTATRDYVFVKDVAKLNVKLINNSRNLLLNVGCSCETSLNDLIKTIDDVSNQVNSVVNLPEREGEVYQTCLDATLVEREYEWKTTTSLKDGISQVWEWITGQTKQVSQR